MIQTDLKQDTLCDLLGKYIWLSLVGPKMETKLSEIGFHGQIAIEVVIWFPHLFAEENSLLSICIFHL